MEAARELVIDAATRHFFQGSLGNGEQLLIFAFLIALENQLNRGSVWKFRRLTEAAISGVEEFGDRLNLRINHPWVEFGFGAGKSFRLRYCVSQGISGPLEVRALIAIGIRHSQQNTSKTGPPALIVGRKIGAAVKRLAVRKQETGKRPTALSGEGANGGLVACIDIRPLVAVDLHSDEMLVNDFGDFGALVAFAVDDMAPVAPDSADVQQYRLVFRLGARKGGIAPFIPGDRLVGGRPQVRTYRILEPIFRL